MRLLLDTHVWLWLLGEPERLGPVFSANVQNAETEVFVSVASVWEVAIKASLGKLQLGVGLEQVVVESERVLGVRVLPIRTAHALAVEALPRHHRDPFDRMLVAQANADGLVLATVDASIAAYEVARVSPTV